MALQFHSGKTSVARHGRLNESGTSGLLCRLLYYLPDKEIPKFEWRAQEDIMQCRKLTVIWAASLLPILCLAQGNGSLCVKANTGRAGVFVDGKYMGPAANFRVARTYAVAAGEHEVKLADPRYEELTTKVTIATGKKTTIHQTLKELPLAKPPFGRLR